MAYEDLEKARTERAAKDAEKEAASKARKTKKAEKGLRATPTAEETTMSRTKRGRKRKNNAEEDTSEPVAMRPQIYQTEAETEEIAARPWQAPVARMW